MRFHIRKDIQGELREKIEKEIEGVEIDFSAEGKIGYLIREIEKKRLEIRNLKTELLEAVKDLSQND